MFHVSPLVGEVCQKERCVTDSLGAFYFVWGFDGRFLIIIAVKDGEPLVDLPNILAIFGHLNSGPRSVGVAEIFVLRLG